MRRIISEQEGAGAMSGALECETLTAMERLTSRQTADPFRSGGQAVNRSIHPLKDAPERHTARGGSHTSRESSLRDSFEQRESGQQTARQQELTERLSEKVQNRLRQQKAKQEKEALDRVIAPGPGTVEDRNTMLLAAAQLPPPGLVQPPAPAHTRGAKDSWIDAMRHYRCCRQLRSPGGFIAGDASQDATVECLAESLQRRSAAPHVARVRPNEEVELAGMASRGVCPSAVEQGVRRVMRHPHMLPSATALPAPASQAEARGAPTSEAVAARDVPEWV